ncbi:MAG TPA: CpsD/CapB family tyrosine-protein kinase [Vicinamibacterales bacterium]|jgi:capsular exopolysaccharide synthesis family protein|nr:CpsD/CapB family tyrosine-protein kinase [Vicinamibacterales bacterium]
MSRIQNILDKAEREGTALRTSRLDVPMAATVPITIEIPTPGAPADAPATIVPGAPTSHTHASSASVASPAETVESFTVRLNGLLIAGLSPKSLAAEQYRQLRTRLAHTEGATSLRTILITSPQKGEGKSITAANLALTMAQELQRRVVIVEADLRKPSLQQLFGLPAGMGLAEYLAGACELQDAMKFLPAHNLTVIPAGEAPGNPAELLGSTAMRRLLDQLRTRFDRVILDTPPVLPLADVAVLAPIVDGTLLVVRAGVTPKPAIENALRAFDSSRLLGVVLNESGLEQDYRYEAKTH